MRNYTKGDAVCLELTRGERTWNHHMQVVDYNLQEELICFWTDEQGSLQMCAFPEGLLVKVISGAALSPGSGESITYSKGPMPL